MKVFRYLSLIIVSLIAQPFAGTPAKAKPAPGAYQTGKLGFSVVVNEHATSLSVLGIFVMPGEEVPLTIDPAPASGGYDIEVSGGRLDRQGEHSAVWHAPVHKGEYTVTIEPNDGSEEMRLNAFVMVPASDVDDGRLNGYRIGQYPQQPLKGLAVYEPPRGFVEVTAKNADTLVAPHLTLGQFLCKQAGGFPKYVVLREELLMKLELVLERLNAAGIATSELTIMSGFRTPAYNEAIGNVEYSRHQWGGAADIYVDVNPKDGRMDDLNGDGVINQADAGWLYKLIDGFHAQQHRAAFVGGLGHYGSNAVHGPFVHVDVRGYRARWGS